MQVGAVEVDHCGRFWGLRLVRPNGIMAGQIAALCFVLQLVNPLPLDHIIRVWRGYFFFARFQLIPCRFKVELIVPWLTSN